MSKNRIDLLNTQEWHGDKNWRSVDRDAGKHGGALCFGNWESHQSVRNHEERRKCEDDEGTPEKQSWVWGCCFVYQPEVGVSVI